MATLLIVEDDAAQRRTMQIGLGERGYDLIEAADGRAARRAVETTKVDLILLDLGLPDVDGTELCRHFRLWPDVPIIIVSAEGDDQRMLAAFERGADDFVVKPVVLDLIAARIAVHLRYAQRLAVVQPDTVLQVGDVRLDPAAHLVEIAGALADLRPQQFAMLELLMRNEGRLVPHDTLRQLLSRGGEAPEQSAVRIAIHRLRTDLGTGTRRPRLVTERHVGYRLIAPE